MLLFCLIHSFLKICTACVFNQSVIFDYYGVQCSLGECPCCVTGHTHMKNIPRKVFLGSKNMFIYFARHIYELNKGLACLVCARTHQPNTWPWQGRGALCADLCASRGLSHRRIFFFLYSVPLICI